MNIGKTERLQYLDALRGFAVILMLQQHLGVWLWNAPFQNFALMISEHPVFMAFNGAGGIAAPIFITLSGAGAFLMIKKSNTSDTVFIKRGVLLIISGYLLNILTPSWFSPGSWYVLHLIGFALICTPVLVRMSDRVLLAAVFSVLALSIALQIYLNTPLQMGNDRMSNYKLTGGVFRLIFAEGHFPVFPWLAYFVSGMLAGRWLYGNKRKRILYYSVILCSLSVLLDAISLAGGMTCNGPYLRIFRFNPNFYPSHLPISLLLISLSSAAVYLSTWLDGIKSGMVMNVFVSLGRSSLTILFVHVVIFKEISLRLNFYRKLPEMEGMLLVLLIISLFMLLSVLWRRINYRYGLEWILRTFS